MRKIPERSLDALNVAVAGMRDGVGPLLSVFLIQYAALDPTGLSWVMAAPGIAALCLQIPLGFIYDKVADRRKVLAGGGLAMLFAAFVLSRVPGFYGLLGAQAITGLAMALLSVGVPALSLQISGKEGFGKRLARNEVFCKVGNFSALGLTGLITQKLGLHLMFYVIYAFAAAVILASFLVPKPEPEALQPKKLKLAQAEGPSILEALKSPPFLALIFLTTLYFFGNSSMLFVFEQRFVPAHPNGGAGYISTAMGMNQVVVFFATLYLARKADLGDPIRILGIGFLLMLVRGLAYAGDFGLYSLGLGEFLDGFLAAIVIIVPSRAIASLCEKNFNVLSGFVGTAACLGASLSTIGAGYFIKHFGHSVAFLIFAGVGALGLAAAAIITGATYLKERFARAPAVPVPPLAQTAEALRPRSPCLSPVASAAANARPAARSRSA